MVWWPRGRLGLALLAGVVACGFLGWVAGFCRWLAGFVIGDWVDARHLKWSSLKDVRRVGSSKSSGAHFPSDSPSLLIVLVSIAAIIGSFSIVRKVRNSTVFVESGWIWEMDGF